MNWRSWLYNELTTDAAVIAIVPAPRILAAGSLEVRQEDRPFIVVRLGPDVTELSDGGAPEITSQEATIWVHDEPGSYKRIDTILAAVRKSLVGQVVTAIACIWQGDSGELADPTQGTIVRNSSYRLVGRPT
jgi:hypothetical protein